MRGPASMLRVVIEFIFILLGALILWVAVTGRYFFNRRSVGWIALGAALVVLGARSILRASQSGAAAEDRIRGASHALVGLLMLSVASLPFEFVGPLLGIAGGVLMLRGAANTVIVLRGG